MVRGYVDCCLCVHECVSIRIRPYMLVCAYICAAKAQKVFVWKFSVIPWNDGCYFVLIL